METQYNTADSSGLVGKTDSQVVSQKNSFTIWWAYTWRLVCVNLVLYLVAAVILRLTGKVGTLGSVNIASAFVIILYLGGSLLASFYVLHMVLNKNYKDFKVSIT